MNSPFAIEQATHLAKRTASADGLVTSVTSERSHDESTPHHTRITHLFQHALGRTPTDDEIRESQEFINTNNGSTTALTRWEQLAQILLMSNEFAFVD